MEGREGGRERGREEGRGGGREREEEWREGWEVEREKYFKETFMRMLSTTTFCREILYIRTCLCI